jgi:hypothetical protein
MVHKIRKAIIKPELIPEGLNIIVVDYEGDRMFGAKFDKGKFIPEKEIKFEDIPISVRPFGKHVPVLSPI